MWDTNLKFWIFTAAKALQTGLGSTRRFREAHCSFRQQCARPLSHDAVSSGILTPCAPSLIPVLEICPLPVYHYGDPADRLLAMRVMFWTILPDT